MTDALIQHLRDDMHGPCCDEGVEAANRIEALEESNKTLSYEIAILQARIAELERKR